MSRVNQTEGFGSRWDGLEIDEVRREIARFEVKVPKGAQWATIYVTGCVNVYNRGGAGFLYVDMYAGNDYGTEHYADFDTNKWNDVVALNQTKMNVEALDEVKVSLLARADEALDIDNKLGYATVNGIVIFE